MIMIWNLLQCTSTLLGLEYLSSTSLFSLSRNHFYFDVTYSIDKSNTYKVYSFNPNISMLIEAPGLKVLSISMRVGKCLIIDYPGLAHHVYCNDSSFHYVKDLIIIRNVKNILPGQKCRELLWFLAIIK